MKVNRSVSFTQERLAYAVKAAEKRGCSTSDIVNEALGMHERVFLNNRKKGWKFDAWPGLKDTD